MTISVILTSYNHEKFIRQSIDSILNQTYSDFELIIVDDCSTDASWDIICEYKDQYPDITAIRHDHNWGGGSIEDTVKNYASGEYIAVHHCDDIWEKDKLQRQIEVFSEHSECGAVFTNASVIDDSGKPYEDAHGFYYNLFQVENRSRYEWLNYFFYHGNCLCHPSILIKKNVYEEDGFFRKGLRQIPDFVKWIQVCKRHEIYVLPQKLVRFRVHSEGKNTSGMRTDTMIRSSVESFLMLREYEDISPDDFLKIFPETKKYFDGKHNLTQYALGRLCTEEGMPAYTRIYGIQLLYKLLNDPYCAKVLKDEHGFDSQQFKLENGKFDIFGILPKVFGQTRSVYYDTGNGFNTAQSLTENYTLGNMEKFTCSFEINEQSEVKRLRFDPAEGVMVKVKLDKVTVNGLEATWIAENALCCIDGKELFVNLDPIYTIEIPDEAVTKESITVCIAGIVERLTDGEIAENVVKVIYNDRNGLYACQAKLYEQEELGRVQQVELRERAEQMRYLNKDLVEAQELVRVRDQRIAEKEEQVQILHEGLAEKEEQMRTLHEGLAEEKEQVRVLHERIAEREEELNKIKSTILYKVAKKIGLMKV